MTLVDNQEFTIDVSPDTLAVDVDSTVYDITLTSGGPPGGSVPSPDLYSYRHVQATPSSTWTINHPLLYMPSVTVVNSAKFVVIGEIQYVGESQVVLHFSGAFSGEAYLS